MNEVSPKFPLPISLDTHNATSLLVLAAGPTRSASPTGPKTSPSGLVVVLASPSVSQGKDSEKLTNVISGLCSLNSSSSASLQSSLESRLRAKLARSGSPEYSLTWKHWPIDGQEPICALRASALRTSDKDFGGLPTPSGTTSGKNHVAGRLDEWGGSTNPFRGTSLGKVRCAAFELWMMGYPMEWQAAMARAMQSCRKSRKSSSRHT